MGRHTHGRVKGTTTGSTYKNHNGKLRRGTDSQVGMLRDELKQNLVGKRVKGFGDLRKRIRQTLASLIDNGTIQDEITPGQLKRMRRGNAPYAPHSQRLEYDVNNISKELRKTVYNLHHKKPIKDGGDPLDIDNIVIASPRYHDEGMLSDEAHFGPVRGRKIRNRRQKKRNKYREQVQTSDKKNKKR